MANLLGTFVEEGLMTFVLGMLVTFLGIATIIIFIALVGKLLSIEKNDKKTVRTEPVEVLPAQSDEISPEVKAAIVAVITAYYFNASDKKCDFKVKKIKRI